MGNMCGEGIVGQLVASHNSGINDIILSKGMVYAACGDGTIRAFSASAPSKVIGQLQTDSAVEILYSNGTDLVSGHKDGSVRLWDLAEQKIVSELQGEGTAVNGLVDLDGPIFRSTTAGDLVSWDPRGGPKDTLHSELTPDACRALATTNGLLVSAGSTVDNAVYVWDLIAKQPSHKLTGHFEPVTAVQCHESSIFSGSVDKTVRHWDIDDDFRCVATYRGARKRVLDTAFGKEQLFIAARDETIRAYRDPTLCTKTFLHNKPVQRLLFNDGALYLVAGNEVRRQVIREQNNDKSDGPGSRLA
eukprot:TRINITY_DN34024_c0_g1_i1.p1 TRINITY_DN34024_c0_g1~~TRINITY_DN34024_c0_g1_i1.p1  ORF type:complete len:303 (+),score=34.68 TRINITY_DN34024_c0_g1_i1:47-955(+)